MRRTFKRGLFIWGGLFVLGCADGGTLPRVNDGVSPRLSTSTAPPEGAPPEFNELPAIINWWAEAQLPSGTVVTSGDPNYGSVKATMVLFGNWGRHEITIRREGNNNPFSEMIVHEEPLFPVPWRHQFESEAKVYLPKQCGFSVSGTAKHITAHVLPFTGGTIRWGDVIKTSYAPPAAQPPCEPCPSTGTPIRPVTYDSYDPYDPDDGGCGGGGGDGGGGDGGGSGYQYSEGESTGGETVGWSDGVGNGGASACGTAAVVRYVCIEIWDGTSWVSWSCGWATTC